MIKIIEDTDSYNLERRVNEYVNQPGIRVLNIEYRMAPSIHSLQGTFRDNPVHFKSTIVHSVMIQYA